MIKAALPLHDTQSAAVSDHQIDPEVARLAATIDLQSALSIQQFGREVAERSSQYADEILQTARATDLDGTGAQLNEIVVAAQQFNLSSLDSSVGRIPLIGGILKRLARSKERAVARFDTVKGQVDKLVAQIETTAQTLSRRNQDYQLMYEGVRTEYAALGQHVQAIELRLRDMEAEIGRQNGASGDLASSEYLAVLEANRQQLSKRADDMRVLQHAAMQTLPMVRIIQANNLALVDKFQTIRQLTLPAWKRAFMLALTLDEQKSAVALADSIDSATNDIMRRNAELLHQNSVATAKSNQRLVVDVETLQHVHDKILLTLTDVRDAHEKGATDRRQAIGELERLRREMLSGVKAAGADGG
ncbi:toxic anion resistance protein [Rhizobium etli bv. mimosae str. IE4771]|uniref:Toxic anion resistance protein n=1 Tax=Rhizobium etli bv. mimosae str. IE4771 TaxID=1432050 RepID=A0A060HTH1_RHIET|nr:toxic anion resistance protein [Rhizobium sp. IE4771]AIC26203.1 toxic anion resistance protein [Rhizobium sp. IE4771]